MRKNKDDEKDPVLVELRQITQAAVFCVVLLGVQCFLLWRVLIAVRH